MQNILIYKKVFYRQTETFIYRQVSGMTSSFNIYLAADEFVDCKGFDFANVTKVPLNPNENFLNRKVDSIFKRKQNRKYTFYNQKQISDLITKEKISVIHAHFGMSALKILKVAKKNRVPLVVSFHGLDASHELRIKNYRKQLPELFDYAAKIIVVSRHMIESLNLSNWIDKVVLLPYSIDTESFKPFQTDNINEQKIKILHSGRVVPKKGVPDLIEVFARLYRKNESLRLIIIGDGPELEYCRKKAASLMLSDAIEFLGAQPIDVVKRKLNEADIFVLNSRVDETGNMEGTPVSILEAMSMGKAVVSTYHAGIPDVIQNGKNGLLVSEKDNNELEEALFKLIKNENQRIELGREARKTIIENYSNLKLLPRLVETIKSAVNSPVGHYN